MKSIASSPSCLRLTPSVHSHSSSSLACFVSSGNKSNTLSFSSSASECHIVLKSYFGRKSLRESAYASDQFYSKSAITFGANMQQETQLWIKARTGIIQEGGNGRYLGSKIQLLGFIKDKVLGKYVWVVC